MTSKRYGRKQSWPNLGYSDYCNHLQDYMASQSTTAASDIFVDVCLKQKEKNGNWESEGISDIKKPVGTIQYNTKDEVSGKW
jgi:hypothetical protein